MLAQLEKLTLELAAIGGEIVQLTREFQEKWSQNKLWKFLVWGVGIQRREGKRRRRKDIGNK